MSAPVRIAAYGYFGMGNIGNEGSLAALVHYVRTRHPDAVLRCYAAGPDAVQREHGVSATQLMSFRADPRHAGPLAKAVKAASRLWDIPRTFTMMGDVDVLVVPGTGVLETKLVATPWGLPYWLFVAALSCRLRRRKVALVSVGAEYAPHPVTRWLYRWTVRLSSSCTYRDEESRDAVRSMGVRRRLGEVFPDLAFSLPTPEGRPERPGHLVIGVMSPPGGPERRRGYVERMTDLITRLTDDGRTVTLVIGDLADRPLAEELDSHVRAARPQLAPGGVAVSGAETLEQIMVEMSEAEVVVASRFHNLICALKLAKPTVSLGYAEKNAHLLAEFGLGRFSQAIESFDVDLLVEQIAEVRRAQPAVEALMKEALDRLEGELEEQFRQLSTDLFDSVTLRRS